jgi:hypothetical protein
MAVVARHVLKRPRRERPVGDVRGREMFSGVRLSLQNTAGTGRLAPAVLTGMRTYTSSAPSLQHGSGIAQAPPRSSALIVMAAQCTHALRRWAPPELVQAAVLVLLQLLADLHEVVNALPRVHVVNRRVQPVARLTPTTPTPSPSSHRFQPPLSPDVLLQIRLARRFSHRQPNILPIDLRFTSNLTDRWQKRLVSAKRCAGDVNRSGQSTLRFVADMLWADPVPCGPRRHWMCVRSNTTRNPTLPRAYGRVVASRMRPRTIALPRFVCLLFCSSFLG